MSSCIVVMDCLVCVPLSCSRVLNRALCVWASGRIGDEGPLEARSSTVSKPLCAGAEKGVANGVPYVEPLFTSEHLAPKIPA